MTKLLTTWGLALLGQDVVIFIIINMAAVVRADVFQFSFLLLSSFSVFQLGFSNGRNSNATPAQSPVVSCHYMKKRILLIFVLIIAVTLIIGMTCFRKNYRLSKSDIAFNPYHIGDSLFFQSDKGERDTIKIVSMDKETLSNKSYFFTDFIKTYVFGTTWEGYYVISESADNHGEAGGDLLTIRVEPNGTKTIMFNLPLERVTWYGNEDMENNINKVLNLPSGIFNRGSQKYNDVIIIPSSNQEYRTRDNFIEKLYWSKSNGYVGFDMLNGSRWTVVKK